MDEAKAYCEGCFRTIPEITEWSGASEARKQEILDLIAVRQAALFDGPTAGAQPA
jgi:predicted Fe-S protein YdhL (DUF1289 family)